MTKRKESWFKLTEPDGSSMIASKNWVQNFLEITAYVKLFKDHIHELQDRISTLEQPLRRARIVELLKKDADVRGGFGRTFGYLQRRISPKISYYDVYHLEAEKKIEQIKSGHHTLWRAVGGE